MAGFLFQASADHYDLRVRPVVGEIVWWSAQRYRSLMRPGGLVFFWLAGADTVRGVHGWGTLVSAPYEASGQHRVDVRFERRIAPHLSAGTLRADPILRDHPIFTVRVGSNFLLEDAEIRALIGHVALEQRPEFAEILSGAQSTEAAGAGRSRLLATVTRPIAWFALVLLVLEATFGVAVARARAEDVLWLLLIDAAVLCVLIGTFAVLLRVAPAALMMTDWLREPLAESLAEAVVDGLHGAIANLDSLPDQARAWVDLLLWLERQHRQESVAERQFRQFLRRGIHDRAIRRMPQLRQAIEDLLRAERSL